jgi:hypothetical protein
MFSSTSVHPPRLLANWVIHIAAGTSIKQRILKEARAQFRAKVLKFVGRRSHSRHL